ncbi:ankyrin repeat domain-containing protein 24 [Zootoca vivipara]|uniref:ankyrin repeat domain-containing protein 24 n=1 Tax=Zootoca vivipara TaxID=8524 RepID=UPI0015910D42|nr:ankyrin repeat domain-containing protein 24 [Zootoca vivipara]
MATRYFLGGTMKQICFCAASSFASQDWSKNDEKLLQAVEYNDAERVASLLVRKSLVSTKLDSEGKSAFHLAATKGNTDCLEVMLAHGADAMTTDGSGYTALHLSAKHGHPQCVSKLLQASCPVDVADSHGRTALHHAAVNGCISCLEILCDFKAPLNTKDKDGATPLTLAAKMSHSELCRYLLHRGAAVNTRDQRGRTALMVACENGSVETVEVLVHGGARVGLVDATGHDAAHYGAAVGNALIQHYLQEAAQRYSWASEEESTDASSQTSSPRHSLTKGKNSSPRKRKAPPPPGSAPSQEDQEAYEEIVRLRQERAQLLQKIRNLEQRQETSKLKQLDDGSLHTLQKQVEELQKQLEEKAGEKENLRKELETLRCRLSSNEKENTSYGIETLQDEEEDLLEFPGAELLLSKKSLSVSTEELLASLQGQVDSLTQKNKELMEKIQVLENYEKDESDADISADFIPIILYDSLRSEFDRLKEQHTEAQEALKSVDGAGEPSCKLIPAEAYEQLKADHEKQIRALKLALEKSSFPALRGGGGPGAEGSSGLGTEGDGSRAEVEARKEEMDELAKELSTTREKYQAALAEVKLLQEQMELGILSVEEKELLESCRTELETTKIALHQARLDLEERDRKMKDLEGRLRAQEEAAAAGCSVEEDKERKASLDEVSREKEALLARCASAEAEVRELKEKTRQLEEEGSRSLREEAGKLRSQLDTLEGQRKAAKAEAEQLRKGREALAEELRSAKEELASRREQEDAAGKLRTSLSEAEKSLSELKERHNGTLKELVEAREAAESCRRGSVPLAEHARAKEALEGTLWELKAKSKLLEQELKAKDEEAVGLKAELEVVLKGAVSKEAHEELRARLQGEADALSAKLADLGRKHERTCTEVFQVQREALFMKSEKHAAEAQLAAAEKQLQGLRAESERIRELHKHIEDSAKLVKEKDRKITELSKEVFKLKEALNDLSELSGEASAKATSPKMESRQEVTTLQGRIRDLEQQLAETERRHGNIVSLYRGHLLYAIQGHMDEDIQRILFQILKMQRLQDQGR